MDFKVRAHSIQLSAEDRDYAEKKIGKAVQKILGSDGNNVDVEISNLDSGKGAHLTRVKVNVYVPHAKTISVHVDNPDVKAGIDVAADKIWRAVKRLRQKRRDSRRNHTAPVTMDVDPAEQTFSGEDDPAAISAERLPISPTPR
ncbi:MAG: HPF/RaiA family ribosome-associated protein [Deltaproteobacteria bacterium]|nr:HPF/RaiA family ribosome-associated protein [Deltaproteobacteria bacterium]